MEAITLTVGAAATICSMTARRGGAIVKARRERKSRGTWWRGTPDGVFSIWGNRDYLSRVGEVYKQITTSVGATARSHLTQEWFEMVWDAINRPLNLWQHPLVSCREIGQERGSAFSGFGLDHVARRGHPRRHLRLVPCRRCRHPAPSNCLLNYLPGFRCAATNSAERILPATAIARRCRIQNAGLVVRSTPLP